MIGLQKYGLSPVILSQDRRGKPVHPVDDPVPVVATRGAHALAEPFLVHLRGTGTANTIEEPAPAIAASG